jgi:hypothetical protein
MSRINAGSYTSKYEHNQGNCLTCTVLRTMATIKRKKRTRVAGPVAQAMEKPHGSPAVQSAAYNHLNEGRQKLQPIKSWGNNICREWLLTFSVSRWIAENNENKETISDPIKWKDMDVQRVVYQGSTTQKMLSSPWSPPLLSSPSKSQSLSHTRRTRKINLHWYL